MTVHALSHAPSSGARLVSTTGLALPLRATTLDSVITGAFACTRLEQRFYNPYDDPLEVTYTLPLPADGAVAGFEFTVGDERCVGVVERRETARERYEAALLAGQTASLLDQDRSSLFEQRIGNIPSGGDVLLQITIDHPLAWLGSADDAGWEWRFPTVVAPRYQGAPGRVTDAAKTRVDVADTAVASPVEVRVRIDHATGRPVSPSGTLSVSGSASSPEVSMWLPAPSRDLVVRWPAATPQPGVHLESEGFGDAAFGTLTLIPPAVRPKAVGRDLILLIDTSGSQMGEPLAQSLAVAHALVDSLDEGDQLEMTAFSTHPEHWKPRTGGLFSRRSATVAMSETMRASAHRWLDGLRAGGATEMKEAIAFALAGLRPDAQRQVLVITDGLIGFEQEIIGAVLNGRPESSRVHVLGVGHGVNRSLTGPVARAGGGVEAICAPGEPADAVCERLLAAMNAPIVVGLRITGTALVETAWDRVPDLFAGRPATVPLRLSPAGGTLVVRGRTADGIFERQLSVSPTSADSTTGGAARRFARERVEALECRLAAGSPRAEVDPAIEALGLTYQISTRLTSWVATSTLATVDADAPFRRETMPHVLADGLSAQGVGLRAAAGGAPPAPARMMSPAAPLPTRSKARRRLARPSAPPAPDEAPKGYGSSGPVKGELSDDFEAFDGFASDGGGAPDMADVVETLQEEAPELALEAPLAQPMKPSGDTLTLDGTLERAPDGTLTLVLTPPPGCSWRCPAEVEVRTRDGRVLTVRTGRATRPTRLSATAQSVRLTLLTGEPVAAIEAVFLFGADERPNSVQRWVVRLPEVSGR